MQISILLLIVIYLMLLGVQYGFAPMLIERWSLKRNGFKLIAQIQVLIVLFSCWVGASKDAPTSSIGAGMLIVSVIFFGKYLTKTEE